MKPTLPDDPSGPTGPVPRAPPSTGTPSHTPGATLAPMLLRTPYDAGHCLGRYRIEEVIGHGASSVVYRATDTALSLPVVVKVLSPDASASVTERFKNEILFSRRVSHAGFSRIFELHDEQTFDGPLRFLTMEFIDGRTLGDVMNEGEMPELRALTIARTLCDIITVAHEQGVVHGDLKPGNVMVRAQPTEKRRLLVRDRKTEPRDDLVVLDFGAATASDAQQHKDAGVRVGSVRYMAPELFSQIERPSPQSDVWAIGVILYACLTSSYPFDGDTEYAIVDAMRRPPRQPSQTRAGLSPSTDAACLRALTRDRSERFADCRAFGAALDEAIAACTPRPSLLRRLLTAFRP